MSDLITQEPTKKYDLRSKIIDGLLAALILYLLTLTLFLLLRPFQTLLGRPGVLSVTFGIVALSIYCLERSLVTRFSEPHRAWYGIAGGVMAWVVIEAVYLLGTVRLTSLSSIVSLLLIGLIIATLWRRRILTIGVRFYAAALILGYSGHILIDGLRMFASWMPAFNLLIPGTGIAAIVGLLAVSGWLFFRTEWRIQRMWCALWMWCLLVISLYAFRGGVI